MLGATRHGCHSRRREGAEGPGGSLLRGPRPVPSHSAPHGPAPPVLPEPVLRGAPGAGWQGHAVLTYRGVGLFILMRLKQVEGAAGEATAQPARPRRLLPPADPRPARELPPPLPVGSGTCTRRCDPSWPRSLGHGPMQDTPRGPTVHDAADSTGPRRGAGSGAHAAGGPGPTSGDSYEAPEAPRQGGG